MNQTLEKFKEYLKEVRQYDLASTLLTWDLQTMTPPKGLESKMDAIGFFSTKSFRLLTAAEYGAMLEELSAPEQFNELDTAMQITVKRYLREYRRFKRVPEDFYTEMVTTSARSEKAWEKAREEKDFSLFLPYLDKMISLKKQYINYMEPDEDPYEVLLDTYEEGMDSVTIEKLFTELKEGLVPLLAKIQASPQPDLSALAGSYDIDAQKKVQNMLLDYIGFDFEAGAVAQSAHPFTMDLCPGDTRVTNHYYETQPISSIFSAIHEGGHAIFGQNIDPVYEGTAVEQVNLMGLHESQSRFYENILGRNKNFWVPIYAKLGELLPQFQTIPLDVFYRAINDVHPSFIRTEADEVTYCLHIILRFEMEKAIFKDHVPTEKLPALWNDKMEELLGIRPSNDAEGILQDMHWSDGSFGYFPSYLLGNIYDGMFLEQIEKELGSLDTILAEGRIREITAWLNEKIHKHGSLYNSREVLQRVCGREISAKPLLDYFNKKYSEIYGF
ncbi:MAG: carboxypeptidase M32 [Eubacteriales bacterium]|nr:carboxypeptidase M32 [Eubacteriales bacterium]